MLNGLKYRIKDGDIQFITTPEYDSSRGTGGMIDIHDPHSSLHIEYSSSLYPEILRRPGNRILVCLPGKERRLDSTSVNCYPDKLSETEIKHIMKLIGIPNCRNYKITVNTRKSY